MQDRESREYLLEVVRGNFDDENEEKISKAAAALLDIDHPEMLGKQVETCWASGEDGWQRVGLGEGVAGTIVGWDGDFFEVLVDEAYDSTPTSRFFPGREGVHWRYAELD